MDEKCALLKEFHEKTNIVGYSLTGYGEKEVERDLLKNYHHVGKVYRSLKPKYRTVIKDICARMGAGMAEFASRGEVSTLQDYELYCHYVAGLVGIGLSRLWGLSGLETADMAKPSMEPVEIFGFFVSRASCNSNNAYMYV